MDAHKLLVKQMKKYLPDSCANNPELKAFLHAINDSYQAFERDKTLLNHAFSQSEKEYQEVFHNLNIEYELKKESIDKLYQSLHTLDDSLGSIKSQDLGELAEYVFEQIKKRKQIEIQLNRQFEFQKLLMNIATTYINLSLYEIEPKILNTLEEIAKFVQADRAYVFNYDFQKNTSSCLYEFHEKGISSQIATFQHIPLEPFKILVDQHKKGNANIINNSTQFPDKKIRELLFINEVKSMITIPLMIEGECTGFVGFDSVTNFNSYGQDEKALLQLFAQVLSNVRQRLEIEKTLTRTNELLKTLIANLQYGILVENEKREILFTNQMFCDMFQIPGAPNQLEGIDCSNSAEQAKHLFLDEEGFSSTILTILRDKKIVRNELLETKSGKFYERDYVPLIIDGKNRGHLWKYHDVTDRIITQNLLLQSEVRNRLIMSSATNAIITINEHGNITFWNKSAERIFGWESKEVLGKELAETIVPKEFKDAHKKGIRRYKAQKESSMLNKQMEITAIRKSGEEFPIEIAIIPIQQDGKEFFCSFIQDISERKRAENNLKVQEEKYRNIIANMKLGLLELDNQDIIQYVNQSFCTESGFDVDEILGKKPVDLFHNLKLNNDHWKSLKKGVSNSKIIQIPIQNKRGELRWWAVSNGPNFDDKGNLIGSIGIHLDITDQKNLEGDLKKEKEKAQAASMAKEAFLANMSHEIRTPLHAIIGFLRELNKSNLHETEKLFVENSIVASQHLLSIINNILDVSKIDAGEMPLEIKEFSLKNSIKNVIRILSEKSKLKNLVVNANCDQSISETLRGDRHKIEQILYNLVGNALKFTKEGEVLVTCEAIKDQKTSQKIKLTVSDTGIGMSKEFIDKIFLKFYQEDESIARRFGGTGLGMAITHELVKLMNGTISINSKKGVGTQVEVILTLEKGTEPQVKKVIKKEKSLSVKGKRILLVEDNELNRMVALLSLNNFQCEVISATNGAEAIDLLTEKTFDLILMDVQMPELDGIETTKILRTQYMLTTPIVALTANAFKTEIEKYETAGMNGYLAKPFTEDTLFNTIYKFTSNSAAQTNLPSPTPSTTAKPALLYNLRSIRKLSLGNEEFIQKMIEIFIKQTTETLAKTHQFFQEKNHEEIAKNIHKIRPSIEGFEILSIIDDVRKLEKAAKEKTTPIDELFPLFLQIESVLVITIEQLKQNEM